MALRKIIRLADHREAIRRPASHSHIEKNPVPLIPGVLTDTLGRPLRDLRISVTDRCNFRCSYCMPREIFDDGYAFLPRTDLLSFEEIERLARLFVALGVTKIRLTGGEPLLRKGIETLVGLLSQLRTPDGEPLDLALTTNASLLARKAQALKDAGLTRLTVSLDALDDAAFRRMNDADHPVAEVLTGIEAAQRAGLQTIKVNMVVKRGVNDDEILPMARRFRHTPVVLRFIEYMDVGTTNGWRRQEVLPSDEVIARLHQAHPLQRIPPRQTGETAVRWRYQDGAGEVGVISSVTQAFCGTCNRARLSTEGRLFTCLFARQGHDLRGLLRSGRTDAEILSVLGQLWRERDDQYSELRGTVNMPAGSPRVEMHYIGG